MASMGRELLAMFRDLILIVLFVGLTLGAVAAVATLIKLVIH